MARRAWWKAIPPRPSGKEQVLIERDSPAVSGGGGGVPDGDVPPWQGRKLPVGDGLVGLDHDNVVGLLGLDQPGDVRLDRVQGVEGNDSAGQVQRCQ
jgi:hypothetical protein